MGTAERVRIYHGFSATQLPRVPKGNFRGKPTLRHQRCLESRQTFIGQARMSSPAPVGLFSGLRGSGSVEISGKRRRFARRDWKTPFAIGARNGDPVTLTSLLPSRIVF